MPRRRGARLPAGRAAEHAFSGLRAACLREGPSTARAALRPRSPRRADSKIRSTTAAHEPPMRSARRRMRPAFQSECDLPFGMPPPCAEWRLRA